jgi:hypothetical protein
MEFPKLRTMGFLFKITLNCVSPILIRCAMRIGRE